MKLIENTFFREFRAVDGMADVYQKWNGQGAAFAFVSSSPWQLYLPLSDFLAKSGFPAASYYLKPFSFKDPSVANVLSEPDEHKLKAIRELLARHPSRRVVLVGDSGERDPEIYGQVARENPEQVARILIRRVATDETNDARFEKAFESVPAAIWSVFDNADELPAHID